MLAGKKLCGSPLDIPSLQPLYEKLLDYFVGQGIKVIPPELLLYSSFNKKILTKHAFFSSETEPIPFLLFDTHLLDVLGSFTKIFLAQRNADLLSRKLTFQILSESLYVKAWMHEALYFAYLFRAAKGIVAFPKERNQHMARHLLVQEAFILCHELSHWCFFRCNEQEKQRQLAFKRTLWSRYLDDLIENRRHRADSNGIALLSKMKQYIQSNDNIVEEVVCDTFAAIFLIEFMVDINDYDKIDIVIGSFLCIQNLQLLSFLDHVVGSATGYGAATDQLTFKMTLRMILFKHHIYNYFYTYARDDAECYNHEITVCKGTYDERVFFPFMDVVNQAGQDIPRLRLLPEVSVLDEKWNIMNNLIRELLTED